MKCMVNFRDQVTCYSVITSGEMAKKLIRNLFVKSKALYVIMKFNETSNVTFTDLGECLLLQRPEFHGISVLDVSVSHQRKEN